MAHHEFSSGDTLARNLANDVAAALGRRLAADGTAGLVVSGGRTPAAFLRALASRELGWSNVTVTLADERWVAVNTVIQETLVRELIPKLKACGAAGIVEYPLSKIVA